MFCTALSQLSRKVCCALDTETRQTGLRVTQSLPTSCLRQSCTGQPNPHGDDTQPAGKVLGARLKGWQANVKVRPHSLLITQNTSDAFIQLLGRRKTVNVRTVFGVFFSRGIFSTSLTSRHHGKRTGIRASRVVGGQTWMPDNMWTSGNMLIPISCLAEGIHLERLTWSVRSQGQSAVWLVLVFVQQYLSLCMTTVL